MIKATAIKPHTPFLAKPFIDSIRAESKKVGTDIQRDFEKTVKTWKRKPVFKLKVTLNNAESIVTVSTTDKVYGYVDEGTLPHIIRPKRKRALYFRGTFRAKTTPHVINSKAGGSSGQAVFTNEVHHPGTEAREFSRDIQAKYQPILKKRIEQAIDQAARKSGHAINKK